MVNRFSTIHRQASQCELWSWRDSPQGRLAEIIVLDQFSRNIYRDMPQSFACDNLALALAQHAVMLGDARELTDEQCGFLYMPYMHSESSMIQLMAKRLFSEPQVAANQPSAQNHKAIIDRFGRYPHRNAILGRTSTAEELQFLTQPGSSF